MGWTWPGNDAIGASHQDDQPTASNRAIIGSSPDSEPLRIHTIKIHSEFPGAFSYCGNILFSYQTSVRHKAQNPD